MSRGGVVASDDADVDGGSRVDELGRLLLLAFRAVNHRWMGVIGGTEFDWGSYWRADVLGTPGARPSGTGACAQTRLIHHGAHPIAV